MTAPAIDRVGRSFAASGILSLAGSTAGAVFGFALTLVVTRGLGDAGAGVVFQVMAVVTIALAVARLGADSAALWMLPRLIRDRGGEVRGMSGLLLLAGLSGGLVAGLALLAVTPVLLPDPAVAEAVAIAAWYLPAASALLVANSANRGLGSVGAYVAIGGIGLPALRLIAVAAVVALGGSASAVVIGWSAPVVGALLAALVVLAVQVRRRERAADAASARWRPDPQLAAAAARYGAPRIVSAVLEQALLWLDVLLVGLIAGPAAAGVYGAVSRLVAAGLVIDTAIRVVVSPRFSALLGERRIADVSALYGAAARWLVLFSTPVYVLLAVFAPFVLGWFGPDFAAGGTALAVLCAGAIVTFLAGNIHSVLLMSGRSGYAALNKAAALVVSVVGVVLLVPAWGVAGAAVAWAASMVVDAALAAIEVRRFEGIGIQLGGVLRALMAAVAAVGAPAVVAVWALGQTWTAFVVALVVGGALLLAWCLLDRRALQLDRLRSLTLH